MGFHLSILTSLEIRPGRVKQVFFKILPFRNWIAVAFCGSNSLNNLVTSSTENSSIAKDALVCVLAFIHGA